MLLETSNLCYMYIKREHIRDEVHNMNDLNNYTWCVFSQLQQALCMVTMVVENSA